jgi:CubicO group peptidase (beta-lactamase class C family)/pimeloyl-ACP methyl ester carboxylesterase
MIAAALGLPGPSLSFSSEGVRASSLVNASGNRIEYQVRGSGEPTIVFIAGWAGEMTDWEPQLDHFAELSRVVAMDVPGFGRSVNASDRWTMEDFGKDLVSVLAALDIEGAVLVGHSMGAGVILEAARQAPDRVAALVPVDVFHDVDEIMSDQQIRDRVDGMMAFLDSVTEEDVRGLFSTPVEDAVIQRHLETYRSAPRAGWRAAAQSYFHWRNDLGQFLQVLETPIHCINSDRFPNRVAAARRYSANFDVTVVQGVGHAVMVDAPEAFHQALEAIIEELVLKSQDPLRDDGSARHAGRLIEAAATDSDRPSFLRVVRPEAAGLSPSGLGRAHGLFVQAVEENRVLGYQVLVARGGRVALHAAGGVSDLESGQPMTTSTLLNVASMTKSVASVGLLRMVEQDRIGLDDPVAKYLPEFGAGASRTITIRQLLLHTAGYTNFEVFCDGLTPRSVKEPTAPSLLVEARELARRGPDVEPGTMFRYNNLGYNVVGAIIEQVSGMTIDAYLREEIFKPLGMDRTVYDTEIDEGADAAKQYWFMDGAWERLDASGDTIPRASGGLVSTAWDFAKFCQMLLDGGRFGEYELLTPETVALATSPLIEVDAAYLPVEVETDMGFQSEWYEHRDQRGLGLDTHRGLGFVVASDGGYSHAGIYGTFFYVDPNRELVIVILTQSIYGGNPGQAFIEAITDAVIEPSS